MKSSLSQLRAVSDASAIMSDRRNIVVIADEAHRSQYGFRAKVERKSGDISYGFAKYLCGALRRHHQATT
jgi:type I restriction enzyme R subunit